MRSACLLGACVCIALAAGPSGASVLRRASAGDVTGAIGIRLFDDHAGDPGDPRASLYIVNHVAPGAAIERRVEVSNSTASARRVEIYAAAAGIANGSFTGAEGRSPNEVSAWSSITPSALDIPAGGHRTATVAIAVPPDAAPGEQYGVIWAEARSTPPGGAAGITQVSRVGVRMYLSVGPGGPPAANFTIDSVTATRPPHGRPLVQANVRNTGGRALDIAGDLRLTRGPGGLAAGPFPANLGVTLAIGETEPIVIALDNRLPAGSWEARIALHSGLVHRTMRSTIRLPHGVGAASSERESWIAPAIVALGLVLAGLAAAIFAPRRRHRHSRRGAPTLPRAVAHAVSDQALHETRRPGRRSRGRHHRRGRRSPARNGARFTTRSA